MTAEVLTQRGRNALQPWQFRWRSQQGGRRHGGASLGIQRSAASPQRAHIHVRSRRALAEADG
jgi:hypothetical protein